MSSSRRLMPRRKRRVTYVYECQCVLHYGKDHFRCRSAIWRCETKNGLYGARGHYTSFSGSGSDSSSSESSSSGSSSGSKGAASPDESSSDEGDSSSGVDEEQM